MKVGVGHTAVAVLVGVKLAGKVGTAVVVAVTVAISWVGDGIEVGKGVGVFGSDVDRGVAVAIETTAVGNSLDGTIVVSAICTGVSTAGGLAASICNGVGVIESPKLSLVAWAMI